MTAKETPRLLLVSADPGRRARLAERLEDWQTLPIGWRDLDTPARWIDAAGVVVDLFRSAPEDDAGAIGQLKDMPAARALVLVVDDDLDPERLEPWLRRLRPAHLLSRSLEAAALRWAVGDLGLSSPAGRGARPQQRRAPALLGVSAAIRQVIELVRQIAPSPLGVMILGETGTGKELVARALHEESGRRGAFVAVNCGAMPATLLESELFGHERGAFTGADRARSGLFEEANGGTLFLDEIGDTPLAFQVKLLRALESGEIRAVGANRSKRVDVRIVSATHRDLEGMVADESFREDLLYRLNALTIYVPPLRRRAVDIPFLAQHFAEELGASVARDITLSDDFIEALSAHDFPGNVRELRNAVERAVALAAPGEPVSTRALPADLRSSSPAPARTGTLNERIAAVETQAIREALEHSDGNRTKAAERLGLSRVGLRSKMRRLGLEAPKREPRATPSD